MIERAEKRTIEKIKDGRIETEPSATERFITELENTFNEDEGTGEIIFKARTPRDRGQDSPEHEYGADICAVLKVNLREYQQTKGILVQAKWGNGDFTVRLPIRPFTSVEFNEKSEVKRLQGQVSKMLEITPDSFVIVYSTKGFVVVPATSVKGLATNGELYGKPVSSFFKEYLMCFVGDPNLTAYDDATLDALRKAKNARYGILFHVYEEGRQQFDMHR
ncbi:MAG: hypothetical protein WB643_07310 [Candidatus Bathyarchaeia archaeon]